MRPLLRRLGQLLLLVVTPLALAVWACVPEDVPGEVVGTYHFVGELTTNECGEAAYPAANPLEMRVELRRDLELAVWRAPQAPINHGVVEDDEVWRFETAVDFPAYEGCIFVQEEQIVLEGIEGDEPTGRTAIRVVPSPGSDCTPSHAAAGGPFLALPCEIHWELEGEAIAPIF